MSILDSYNGNSDSRFNKIKPLSLSDGPIEQTQRIKYINQTIKNRGFRGFLRASVQKIQYMLVGPSTLLLVIYVGFITGCFGVCFTSLTNFLLRIRNK